MLILLSPAKTICPTPSCDHPVTTPCFQDEANRLALEMSGYLPTTLATKLNISGPLAHQVYRWYQDFLSPSEPLLPAVHAYDGIVFKTLSPETLSPEAYRSMVESLRITSFLYGYLHPLDGIHPYRMEGNVCTEYAQGKSTFAFWKGKLTEVFLNDIHDHGGTLLFLASEEMKKLFDWKRITREATVLQPSFLVKKGGKERQIVVYTKMMRGKMCRYALEHNWQGTPLELADFARHEEAELRYEERANTYSFLL